MEVCSSTEMGAPGASHLGTRDRGPKTDRSNPRPVPVDGLPPRDLPQLVGERQSPMRVSSELGLEACIGLKSPFRTMTAQRMRVAELGPVSR